MRLIILIFCFTFSGTSLWSQNPWQWAIATDTSHYSNSDVNNMTLDSDGNILLTGQYNGSLSLGGTAFTPTLLSGGFYSAKINKSGVPLWKNTGAGSNFYNYSICSDQSNYSYVLGEIKAPIQTFTIGNTVLTNTAGGNALFIIKNDPNGNICWAKIIGKSAAGSGPFGVSIINHNGFLYLSGQFWTSTVTPCSIGAFTLSSVPSQMNNIDIFYARLDTAGTVLSANSYGGIGNETIGKLFISNSNEILFSGTTTSSVLTIGTYSVTGPTINFYNSLFISKMDLLGNINWVKQINDVKGGGNLVTDNGGNIYLAGTFRSPNVIVDNFTLTSNATNSNPQNIMVIKFNSSGNALWVKGIGGSGSSIGGEVCKDITIDKYGGIYVLGTYLSPTIAIGNFSLSNTNTNKEKIFVAQYDQSGNVAGVLEAGGNNSRTIANCLLVDNDYNVIVGGTQNDNGQGISFGSLKIYGSYQNQGNFFLAKAGGAFVGIEKWSQNNSFYVYPNPTNDVLHFQLETNELNTFNVSVTNTMGQLLIQKTNFNTDQSLDISRLPSGVYFVCLESKSKKMVSKVVKE